MLQGIMSGAYVPPKYVPENETEHLEDSSITDLQVRHLLARGTAQSSTPNAQQPQHPYHWTSGICACCDDMPVCKFLSSTGRSHCPHFHSWISISSGSFAQSMWCKETKLVCGDQQDWSKFLMFVNHMFVIHVTLCFLGLSHQCRHTYCEMIHCLPHTDLPFAWKHEYHVNRWLCGKISFKVYSSLTSPCGGIVDQVAWAAGAHACCLVVMWRC